MHENGRKLARKCVGNADIFVFTKTYFRKNKKKEFCFLHREQLLLITQAFIFFLNFYIFQLKRMVRGYSAIVSGLNEELLTQLQIKDDMSVQQDAMLENISELAQRLS
jgi:hypothetical protein